MLISQTMELGRRARERLFIPTFFPSLARRDVIEDKECGLFLSHRTFLPHLLGGSVLAGRGAPFSIFIFSGHLSEQDQDIPIEIVVEL